MKLGLLTSLIFCFYSTCCQAQLGGNYWNLNYGTKAQLLNGAVIGGVEDNSALLYNPAAIGTDTVGGFSLSLFSPSYSIINTNSSQLNNLQISDFDLLPNMAVVDFPFFQNSKIKSSLGLFSKRSSDIDFATQFDINYTPSQNFRGTTNYRNKISEDYLGFGISYKVSDDFQFGFTQGMTIRSQNQAYFINGRANNYTNDPNNQLNFTSFDEYSVTYPSMNTKFGILWHRENYSIGLTMTTPSYFHLLDSGSYQLIEPQFAEGIFIDVLEETQGSLGSRFKYPWSFGLGGVYDFDKDDKVYFSLEYFAPVNQYSILNNPNSEIDLSVQSASKGIANAALGYERIMSESFTLLCGLRTDFNAVENFDLANAGDRGLFRFSWDIYHVTAGGLFSIKQFKFSAGIGYAFSTSDEEVFNPFERVFRSFQIDDFAFEGSPSTYHAVTIFFNYSLLFERLTSN